MTSKEGTAPAAEAEPPREAASGAALARLQRYVPLAVWVVASLTMLVIPCKIISYGYLPQDDALRHAAKAVSGKPWSEILVMRSDFAMDAHPGWHAILGGLHRWQNCNAETLVVVSVVGLMLLVSVAVLPWLRWPESWLAALLMVTVCLPWVSGRLTTGRPYLFTVAAVLLLLLIWSRIEQRTPNPLELCGSVLLLALDAWIHGGWYQMGLPIAALLLAGRWRAATWYSGCWLAGSFLGCALTGHPWQFLYQSTRHLFGVFGDVHLDRQLTSELLPTGGDPTMVLAVIGMLLWRARSPGWNARQLLNPIFMMAVVGWLLGLKMYRFWDDWGLPATTLWLALELQKQFENYLPFDSGRRLLLSTGLGLGLFLASTSDINGRYTWNLTNEYITQDDPELAGWLPEKGGILYNADMGVFFQTFFKNPTAPWRYVLGFEPALMQPDDLQVYRKIQWNYGDQRAYEPWLRKMQPQDRMLLHGPKVLGGAPPNVPDLEWHHAVSDLWLGRLPPATNAAPSAPR